jgi:hypothetical protein
MKHNASINFVLFLLTALLLEQCASARKFTINANLHTVEVENHTWPQLPMGRKSIIVNKPVVEIDSVDLSRHKIKRKWNLSIDQKTFGYVLNSIELNTEALFHSVFYNTNEVRKGISSMDDFINVEVHHVSRQLSEDDNNFTYNYRLGRHDLKRKLPDTIIQVFSKIILRQDICEGCIGTGFGLVPFGVIHYKLAIAGGDKILFYKEYLIPNNRNKFYTNRRGVDDASNWFTKEAIEVLVKHLKDDLQRLRDD